MFKQLKQDCIERFINFETPAGLLFIFFGCAFLLFPEHWNILLSIGCIIYGVRLFLVNRIKEARKQKDLIG